LSSAFSKKGHIMLRKRGDANPNSRARRIAATATALTFVCQNFAWAVCADGTTFPANGFIFGQLPAAANWSPQQFEFPAGSIFIPDNSILEHNDPAQPLTGGGHNWVFDQGADSDDVAQAFRDDVAHRSEMMSPTIPSDAARVRCLRWPAISAIRF
jgi:hypothetical protein